MSNSFESSLSSLVWLSICLPYILLHGVNPLLHTVFGFIKSLLSFYCFLSSSNYLVWLISKVLSFIIILFIWIVYDFFVLRHSHIKLPFKKLFHRLGYVLFLFPLFFWGSFLLFLLDFFPIFNNSVPLGLHEFLCVLQFFLLLISSFVLLWKVEYITLFQYHCLC